MELQSWSSVPKNKLKVLTGDARPWVSYCINNHTKKRIAFEKGGTSNLCYVRLSVNSVVVVPTFGLRTPELSSSLSWGFSIASADNAILCDRLILFLNYSSIMHYVQFHYWLCFEFCLLNWTSLNPLLIFF